MKNVMLILAASFFCSVVTSGGGAQQQAETQVAKWQTSWDAFIDEFQALASKGAKGTDFDEKFRWHDVVWEGTFREVREQSGQWHALIDFTKRQIRWFNEDYLMRRPLILISETELPKWQKLKPGSTVRIRITLSTDNGFHSLIVLGPTGSGYIQLMPQNGTLVEVLKNSK